MMEPVPSPFDSFSSLSFSLLLAEDCEGLGAVLDCPGAVRSEVTFSVSTITDCCGGGVCCGWSGAGDDGWLLGSFGVTEGWLLGVTLG